MAKALDRFSSFMAYQPQGKPQVTPNKMAKTQETFRLTGLNNQRTEFLATAAAPGK